MVVQEGWDNIFQICEIHQNFHEMFGGPLYPKRKTGYNTGINPWEALLEWRPHRNCFVFWTKAPPAITPRPMYARHSRRPEPWSCENQSRGRLERGTLYVVVRGDSALMAFRLPEGKPQGFLLAAAHDDSPTFKLRENAEVRAPGDTLRLSVEPYGGGIWRGWLDRPLSVAGRVMVRQGERLVTRLVNIDRDLLVIPSVAIHMDRTVNKGTALNPAVDLLPLLGCGKETGAFRRLIAQAAGVRGGASAVHRAVPLSPCPGPCRQA